MHIWLLTHSEELKKANGTGKLICQHLADSSNVIVWERNNPSNALANLPKDKTLVIYPSELSIGDTSNLAPISMESVENVIILDGTWQQARKIYNRTPYLHSFQTYEICGQQSVYLRRKNQQKNGLCTAETAIYLLQKQGSYHQAKILAEAFEAFNKTI